MHHLPKKQVYSNKALQWNDVAQEAENENDLILLYVRRLRNNLFHGGKFDGRFFDPERSRESTINSYYAAVGKPIQTVRQGAQFRHRSEAPIQDEETTDGYAVRYMQKHHPRGLQKIHTSDRLNLKKNCD